MSGAYLTDEQEGHFAALDLLQMSGLLNYYGRAPESDNIAVKPVLLQKGQTKLALYGLSNVRDERLFRTFRDGNVRFFQPATQKGNWFNLMSVHQNHHAYTETGYLPENFLPSFMDLVVWGHEHECLIEPRTNPETNFRVMQPGSSVATSLSPGEAVPKHVAILSITGKDFEVETIRLKSVRPFVYKEIALADDKYMRKIAQDRDNKAKIHAYLANVVEGMIAKAREDWLALQDEPESMEADEEREVPLPLIRLRVEYTAPDGGEYEIDNPQRFSSRFVGKVANVTDVVQYHRRRRGGGRGATARNQPEVPGDEDGAMGQLNFDTVRVEKLVEEFLTAQSLTILPKDNFCHAVSEYVRQDDPTVMSNFVTNSLEALVRQVMLDGDQYGDQDYEDDQMFEVIERGKAMLDEAFRRGELKLMRGKGRRKPKPLGWDSDMDGPWEDNIASIIRADNADADDAGSNASSRPTTTRGRGKGGAAADKASAGTTRKPATTKTAPAKTAPAKTTARGARRPVFEEVDDDDDDDVVMLDDPEGEGLFVPSSRPAAASSRPTHTTTASSRPTRTAAAAKPPMRGGGRGAGMQSQLSFAGASQTRGGPTAGQKKKVVEPSDDEISDDDAFEPPTAVRGGRR